MCHRLDRRCATRSRQRCAPDSCRTNRRLPQERLSPCNCPWRCFSLCLCRNVPRRGQQPPTLESVFSTVRPNVFTLLRSMSVLGEPVSIISAPRRLLWNRNQQMIAVASFQLRAAKSLLASAPARYPRVAVLVRKMASPLRGKIWDQFVHLTVLEQRPSRVQSHSMAAQCRLQSDESGRKIRTALAFSRVLRRRESAAKHTAHHQ